MLGGTGWPFTLSGFLLLSLYRAGLFCRILTLGVFDFHRKSAGKAGASSTALGDLEVTS